jgi:DNA ligase 1
MGMDVLMRYLNVAEAYRDLERLSSRLALTERLAALLAQTPDDLLPTVCYLCQGLIAPEFAGVDLGMAEKLAVRAVAATTGVAAEQVTALVRETGDLGTAAERLLASPGTEPAGLTAGHEVSEAARREDSDGASLEVADVVRTLREIAAAEGAGSQGRKLELLGGLLARATPVEACYLLRLVTRNLRLGIGTPTILEALAQVHAGGKAGKKTLERGYNICCDLGTVAATLVSGGLAAVAELRVRPGSPVRVMLAQRLADAGEILARLGGRCAAEYKYDGVRVQAHRTADGRIELFTRRLEEISDQFPDVVELLAAGLGPSEAILEGEVVAYDAAAGELRPFGEVMLRRRKHGIDEAVRDVPVGLFCFELLYADGEDLTMAPYPRRRAALEAALTLSPRLRLTTAAEVSDPAALDAMFAQAVTDGCEGLVCKSTGPESGYQAGARGWQWIKLKRDYRTELSDTADLVIVGAFAGRGRRAGVYGAVLLAAYDADADMFRAVTKCGAGFTDADLAALPSRLAPLRAAHKPARVDARQEPDVWFEPGLVVEILSAELTLSPNYTAAWGEIRDDAGLAMRFPRFTGRWRDDKAADDATTTAELAGLFRTARRTPAAG